MGFVPHTVFYAACFGLYFIIKSIAYEAIGDDGMARLLGVIVAMLVGCTADMCIRFFAADDTEFPEPDNTAWWGRSFLFETPTRIATNERILNQANRSLAVLYGLVALVMSAFFEYAPTVVALSTVCGACLGWWIGRTLKQQLAQRREENVRQWEADERYE